MTNKILIVLAIAVLLQSCAMQREAVYRGSLLEISDLAANGGAYDGKQVLVRGILFENMGNILGFSPTEFGKSADNYSEKPFRYFSIFPYKIQDCRFGTFDPDQSISLSMRDAAGKISYNSDRYAKNISREIILSGKFIKGKEEKKIYNDVLNEHMNNPWRNGFGNLIDIKVLKIESIGCWK